MMVAMIASAVVFASLDARIGRRWCEVAPWAGGTGSILGYVQANRSSGNLAPVEVLDCLRRLIFLRETHERKAPGAAGFPIFGDVNVHDLADFTEELPQLCIRGGEVEVPDEYLVRND